MMEPTEQDSNHPAGESGTVSNKPDTLPPKPSFWGGGFRSWALITALTTGLLVADFWTKHWAQESLQPQPRKSLTVIEGWLSLTYVRNPAGAWGFMRAMGPRKRHYLLLGVSVAAVAILLTLLVRSRRDQVFLRVALGCILAGALGNIVDRIRWRYVVDFIDWHKGFRWPTFNVADIAITAGVIMMAVEIFLDRSDEESPSEPKNGSESPADGPSLPGADSQ